MRSAVALACALLAACDRSTPAPPVAPSTPVSVFAAASLRELVTEIGDAWRKKTGQEVRIQFEASSTLARQIKEGAPADVFITAAPEWLDPVQVIERYDWLSNRLVCVVRKDVRDFDITRVDSLALANEQVPVGAYAKAALAHQGIKLPGRTIYGSNVRDVLSKVSQGGAAAGIVYATDAAVDPEVRVAFTLPEESHPKIRYAVGLLTENGRRFAGVLREAASRDAARRRGFVVIP